MPAAKTASTLFRTSVVEENLQVATSQQNDERADALLLGFPDDRGIAAGGGRIGAAQGPAGLRKALGEYGTSWNLASGDDLECLRIVDGGNVEVGAEISGTHRRIADEVARAYEVADVVIGIGGGHDCSFGGLLGFRRSFGTGFGGVNIDAHLDVRPVENGRITSGTPFRMAIDDPDVGLDPSRFTVLGADPRAGTRGSHAFLVESGGQVVTRRQVAREGGSELLAKALSRAGDRPVFVSLDLDVLAAAHAPGVSAPSPDGLSPREALDLVFDAGVDSRVKYFDIVELSPPLDPHGLTARLAAALLVEFFHGLAARNSNRDICEKKTR